MKFVVLSYARSGSTWLVNTINNIPGVTCYDEMFTLKGSMYRAGGNDFPRYLEWRRSQTGLPFSWRYLNQLYSGTKKTGFKLTFVQAKRHLEFLPYAMFNGIRVIHLVRENTLDLMLSLLSARNRGKFHFTRGEKIPTQPPVYIDPAYLIKKIHRVHKDRSQVRRMLEFLRLRSIEVFYEDLLADKRNFRPIWSFLEADYDKEPPKWQTQKIMKGSHSQSIQNFKEVERALQTAGYGHFLNK